MRYLPDDNLSYPVLVQIGDGSGSGFYFHTDQRLFLVTALHVLYRIEDQDKPLRDSSVQLTSYDRNLSVQNPIELTIDLSLVDIRKNDSKDIVLVEIGKVSSGEAGINFVKGVRSSASATSNIVVVLPEYLKKFDDVLISNEVFILGYPNSLGFPGQLQIDPKKPLLRKGIIAGRNILNETIILDCPVYFGNSGGLAIEVEETSVSEKKFSVIGVISEYIPFVEKLRSLQFGYTNLSFENSGYSVVVPIDTILELTAETPIEVEQPSPPRSQ